MKSRSLLARIYRLKLAVIGISLLLLGLVISVLADSLEARRFGHLLVAFLQALSDALVVTGGLGIAIDFVTGRDREAADTERTRRVLKELTPDFTDAVLRGMAVGQDDLRRVATPELLDGIATNALALRLDDDRFAAEIYEALLAQAIHTPERWEDVDVNVRLSCVQERSTSGAPRLDPQLLFSAVITWEYTVKLGNGVRRFVATDDPDDFREFLSDGPATSAWFIPPGTADPSSPGAFEVLSYSLDGKELPIRRTVRKRGQTYSVDVGSEAAGDGGEQVRVRQVYRTVVPRIGHRFRVSLTQPTHGLRLVLDYTDTDIAELKAGELLSNASPAQIKFMPEGTPAKQVEVSAPGWLLPQAEITFVWTLESELPPSRRTAGLAPTGSVGR